MEKIIITHPVTGENNLQVAINDFQNQMTWPEAIKACSELGSGWRLPSIDELDTIYKLAQTNYKLKFQKNRYWCNAEINDNNAWCINFYDGKKEKEGHYSKKETANYVRAIRITDSF